MNWADLAGTLVQIGIVLYLAVKTNVADAVACSAIEPIR